jgi:D-aminoacyl-tRNA deacylase
MSIIVVAAKLREFRTNLPWSVTRRRSSAGLTNPENHTTIANMRAVLQRVANAEVRVGGVSVGRIGQGILALIAIGRNDTEKELQWMAKKILEIRMFDDGEGKLNLSLQDVGGQLLIVSQFTLYGDCRKGRRPSYIEAAPPAEAEKLYNQFISMVCQLVPDVQTGTFQAMMEVQLTNAGPVTLILES